MFLLLLPAALAASLSTAFTSDAGGWSGGVVDGGVLAVTDADATLAPGAMRTFTFTARVRLVDGTSLHFAAGDATLTASYTDGGGLSFGALSAPLPLDEQAWTPDAAAITDGEAPSVVAFDGGWLLYTVRDGAIVVSSSTDGTTWSAGVTVLVGGAPDAVVDGGQVYLFYACDGAVCRATSADGLSFDEDGVVLDGADTDADVLGDPGVARLADGTWRLWTTDADTGATSVSTSTDALGWTWEGSLSSDATRLHALDAAVFSGGVDAAWDAADGIHVTPGDDAATLAASTADRGPVLEAGLASWSPDAPAAPDALLVGDRWTLWVEGHDGAERHVGRATGTPTPGTWVGLTVTWDGATATAAWGDGPTLSCPLTAADAITLGASGVLEVDEAQLIYASEAGDTGGAAGDTGDTAAPTDTGDTGDTGRDTGGDTGADTSDTGDTAADTGDTAGTDSDTPDTGPTFNASQLSGEPGGWGCSTPGPAGSPTLPLAAIGLALLARRRTERA